MMARDGSYEAAGVPSEWAKGHAGAHVWYTLDKGEPIEAEIVDVEATGSTIRRADGTEAPGIRFLLRPASGRDRWSVTFPDEPEALEEVTDAK